MYKIQGCGIIQLMDRFFFEQRRALPGKGALKQAILDELHIIDHQITHYVITGADPARDRIRQEVKAIRAHIVTELLACTKESK